MFGLLVDPERCYADIRDIVSMAASHGNFIRYGKRWFGYSTRRLKEKPAIVRHLMRALLIKG